MAEYGSYIVYTVFLRGYIINLLPNHYGCGGSLTIARTKPSAIFEFLWWPKDYCARKKGTIFGKDFLEAPPKIETKKGKLKIKWKTS